MINLRNQKSSISFRLFASVIVFCTALSSFSYAQLTGTKNVPSANYPTIKVAVDSLNLYGVGGGGVTFDIAAGYTETLTATLSITATGTAANQIVFQKSGVGANPLITAYTGGTSTPATVGAPLDGIVRLIGSDWVTFDGISLQENAANTTGTAFMEYGLAFYKVSGTNGCNNNTVKNCVITLNRNNIATGTTETEIGSTGIFTGNATFNNPSVALTVTTASGTNSNNKFYSDTIQNCNVGISMRGFTDVLAPFAFYDQSNDIGGNSAATGNFILDFGGGVGAGSSNTVNGIKSVNANAVNISYNIVRSVTGTLAPTANAQGIFTSSPNAALTNINSNTVTVQIGTNSSFLVALGIDCSNGSVVSAGVVNMNNNTIVNCNVAAGTNLGNNGPMTGMRVQAQPAAVNMNNNLIYGDTMFNVGTFTGMIYSGTNLSAVVSINSNQIYNIHKVNNNPNTSGGNNLIGIAAGYSQTTVNNNVIHDFTIVNINGGLNCKISAFNITSPATGTSMSVTNNQVYNLFTTGSSTSTSQTVTNGIEFGGNTGVGSLNLTISGNTFYNFNSTNTALTGLGTLIRGMEISTAININVFNNKMYDFTCTGLSGAVIGYRVLAGQNLNLYNNYIGNFFTPTATSATPEQIIGISDEGTTAGQNHNYYNNTIFLTGTSTGTNFGSSVVKTNVVPNTVLRNNIFINNTTPKGSGLSVAHRRTNTSLATYMSSSNNNIFYATTPLSIAKNIYYDGTNSDLSLAAYKTRVAGRDNASATELTTFLSTVGSSPSFLHVDPTVATAAESGGSNLGGVTTDYDNDIRQGNVGYLGSGSAPDIGADEFGGIVNDLTPPAITAGTVLGACGTGNRTISGVVITDATGVPTTGTLVPRIYYKKNVGGSYFSQPGTLTSGTATNGTWDFTIVAADMGGLATNDSVGFYFIAQDVVGTPNISSVPYGAVATDVNTVTTPPTTVNYYKVLNSLSGTYTVGSGGNYASITAAVAAYNTSCLSGPVVFSLTDANYATETFPITINANPFASATNTLTIKPATGNVSIQANTTTHVFALFAADYVTIEGSVSPVTNTVCPLVRSTRNLTIQNSNGASSNNCVVFIASNGFDGATNNKIMNCNIVGGATAIPWAFTNTGIGFGAGPVATGFSTGTNSLGYNNSNNTVENNNISKVAYGIISQGFSFAIKNQNNVYRLNEMSGTGVNGIFRYGILIGFENNSSIVGNTIKNLIGQSTGVDVVAINLGNNNGIAMNGFGSNENTNAVVSNNTIDNIQSFATISAQSAVGIATSNSPSGIISSGSNLISNNMISGVVANSNGTNDVSCGLFIGNQVGSNMQIYNNTVNLNSDGFATNFATNVTLFVGGSGVIPQVDIKNNILVNGIRFGAGNNFVMGLQVPGNAGNYVNLLSDNNDMYVSNGGGFYNAIGVIGVGATPTIYPGTNNFPTLASWQAQTGRDANSKNVLPVFVSATDMHLVNNAPVNVALNGTAVTLASVPTDIDCESRTGANSPDIGADEFTLPPIDIAFDAIKPTANSTCHSANEPIIVTVRNTGSTTIDMSVDTIFVSTAYSGTISGTSVDTVYAGTLAPNATIDVTLDPTINTTVNGSYTFTTTITPIAGESSTTNNNNVTSITINNTPVAINASVFNNNLCLGYSTPITATSTFGTLPYAYSWSPADGLNTTTGATVIAAPGISTTYTVTVTDGCGNTASATALVNISIPGIQSAPSNSRCGVGSVTLTGVPNPGSTLNWYSTPAGTAIAGTGNTFNTPSINATTTFYVSATTGNVPYYVGLTDLSPANGAVTFSAGAGRGQMITANKPGAITGCIVYPSNASTITAAMVGGITKPIQICLRLRGSIVNIATAGPFTFTTAQLATPVQLTFNLPITTPGDYQVVYDTIGGTVTNVNQVGLAQYSFSYTGTYPLYTADSSLVMPGGAFSSTNATVQLTTYNAFWNVQYTTYCESARQPVVAGFTPTPPMTISPNRAICIGDTVAISVTSNIADYDNYVWTPTNIPFYTDPQCTNLYVTGSSATTIYYIGYAVKADTFICNASNALLCANVASSVITTLPVLTSVSANTYGICGGGTAILSITPATGYATGSIFWESSTDSSNWNPVAGSTATLTTPVLSQKTYFRVSIRNSNNAVCSQLGLDPINVYNPAIISAPGVTRCGVGSVNLVANVSSGATAAWYTSPTSQPSLLDGNSVTSPVIAATTTYYVAAREGSSTYGVGVPAASSTYGSVFVFSQISGFVTPDKPLWITVVKPGVLEKLTVYPIDSGNMTINLRLRGSSTDILVAGPFTITGAQIGTAVELPVYMAFNTPGNYQITNIGLAGAVLSPYNGAAGPYPFSTSDGSLLIVGSANNSTSVSAPTSGYNAMFNLKYSTACESARVPVVVTVTPPPTFTTNVVIDTVCGQTPKMLNVTSPLSNYTTYTWAPAAGLFTDAAGTIPYIQGANEDTVYSNPDSTTVYVATATETLSGCVDTNKIIVTPIYVMPALATNANLTDLCGTGSVLLNVSGVYNSGIATYQWESSPDNSNWTPVLGGTAISLLTPVLTQSTYFHCIVKCTGSPIGSSPSLLINVNNPLVLSTVADTVCGSGSLTLHANPSPGAVINWFDVPTAGIPVGNGSIFSTPVISTTTTYYAEANTGNYTEPVGIANPNLGAGVNLFPGRGLRFNATKQLTINSVTVNNIDQNGIGFIDIALQDNLGNEITSTGLVSNLVFGANVIPLNFVVPVGNDYRLVVKSGAGGVFFSMSNPVTYPMNSFSGAISITGGFTSTGVIAPGVYYLFYGITITAGCYSPRIPVEAFVKQTPVINITPATSVICPGDVVAMHASSDNDPFYSYQWSNGPTGADFTVSPTSTQTYTVIGTDISGGINNGCQKTQTKTINVNPAVVAYTAPSVLYSCGGGSVPITVTPAPVTGIVIAGTGTTFPSTQTSFPAPYGASFESSKHQMLITAAELSASGMAFGSELRSLAFSVLQVDSNVILKAFTIKIAATNQTSLNAWTTTGLVQVFGPVDYDPDSISNEHLFTTPFAWDGVSNIIVETCFSNDPTNSGSFQTSNARMNRTTTSFTSVLYSNVNDFDACPIYPSFNSSTERPNMVLAYTNTADFTWSPAAGLNVTTGTSVIASPAVSTVYTVTATNFFGCTSTKAIPVNLVTPPAPKIVERDSSLCSNNAGYYLHVKDTGIYASGYPTGTYFEWINYTAATDGLDSLFVNSSDNYSVVVTLPGTPYGACSDTSNIVFQDFSNAQAPVPFMEQDSVKCKGGSTGSAIVHLLVGALPGANYTWYNSLNQVVRNVTNALADDTLKNVAAGSYYVVITNNVGTSALSCGEIGYVEVLEPEEIAVAETHVNNLCYQPTGVNVDITVTGGSPAYNYAWSNGETTEDLSGVHVGTYTVVVTDYHGCVATLSVVVGEPTALVSNAVVTNVTCKNAKDGTVTLGVTGGVSPYSYQWNNLSTTSSRSGLAPGTYTVTITDHNGCHLTESYNITQSTTQLANNVQKTNVKCGPKCTGTITSIATGGTPPYKYLWSTGETTQTINNLCAGSYTLTIEDANHCIKTVVVPITQNTPMVLIVAPSGLTQATASVTGGIAPYSYYWNTVPPQTTQTAIVLYPGNTYKVRVTDSKGCSKTGTVFMPLPKLETPVSVSSDLELSVFPNPTTGLITLNFNNYPGELKYALRVYDFTGREVFSKDAFKDSGLIGNDYDFSELSKGIYSLSIQTEMGNKTIKIVIQ